MMKKPCNTSLVKSCCTERCLDYAEWFFSTGEYASVSPAVKKQIEDMTHDDAVKHILMVENIVLDLNKYTMGV
jgi:hypothetical protein